MLPMKVCDALSHLLDICMYYVFKRQIRMQLQEAINNAKRMMQSIVDGEVDVQKCTDIMQRLQNLLRSVAEMNVLRQDPIVSDAKRWRSSLNTLCVRDTTTLVPLEERSFASSNFKHFYTSAKAAPFHFDILSAARKTATLYAARIHTRQRKDVIEENVNKFIHVIQEEVAKHSNEDEHDANMLAEFLWTSQKRHPVVNNLEFCSVLNAVIRDDVAEEIEAAVPIFRSLNALRTRRLGEGVSKDVVVYPPDGQLWRGSTFNDKFRPFFEGMLGKKYRVPGFLATSENRQIAVAFALKAGGNGHPCVVWRITFDPRGKDHPKYRVKHMTFVSKTLIVGEHEYLFAPYSVFTLASVKWSEELITPHEFSIRSALDNRKEDEDLPLTPWY